MKIEDFINKYVILEFKDGTILEGILIEIKENEDEWGYCVTFTIREKDDTYRLVYASEIATISEGILVDM